MTKIRPYVVIYQIVQLWKNIFWHMLYFKSSPWPPLIWHFWSCLTRIDLASTNIDLQMSYWALWKDWSLYYLLKRFLSLKNKLYVQEIRFSTKRWVSPLIYYCSSLVNTKLQMATPKSHPIFMKFESVVQLFMENGKISLK